MIAELFSDLNFIINKNKLNAIELERKKELNLDNDIIHFNSETKINDPDLLKIDYFSKKSGSLDYQKVDGLLNKIKKTNWKSALLDYFGDDDAAQKRVFSNMRINWIDLIDIKKNDLVLDFGCGLGSVSIKLGNQFRVVSIDKSLENIKILNQIRIQDKLQILPMCIQNLELPFNDNSFNLIYLIGSLEWLPYDFTENPKKIIEKYLLEFYRILKPGGKIFIASENSNYIGYYFGIPESHTAIKYLSLLKNNKANEFSKDLRNKDYRELTFDYDSINELLKKSGFVSSDYYWLYPDYSCPHQIIPIRENENLIQYYIDNKLNPWEFTGQRVNTYNFFKLLKTNHVKYFIEHYGIIAQK